MRIFQWEQKRNLQQALSSTYTAFSHLRKLKLNLTSTTLTHIRAWSKWQKKRSGCTKRTTPTSPSPISEDCNDQMEAIGSMNIILLFGPSPTLSWMNVRGEVKDNDDHMSPTPTTEDTATTLMVRLILKDAISTSSLGVRVRVGKASSSVSLLVKIYMKMFLTLRPP